MLTNQSNRLRVLRHSFLMLVVASVATLGMSFQPIALGASTGVYTTLAEQSGTNAHCAITSQGDAKCWGYGDQGQIGNASVSYYSVAPVLVSGGHKFSRIAEGDRHTCALDLLGKAYCWGDDQWGQLGTEAEGDNNVPIAVSTNLTFSSISSGTQFTCALTPAGSAYCWGYGRDGQLGSSSGTQSPFISATPALVSGGLSFTSLSSGGSTTCALQSTGKVYCWGINNYGQFGDCARLGACANASSPTPVLAAGGKVFKSISTSDDHVCALTSQGAAYCWGKIWGMGTGQWLGGAGCNGTCNEAPVAVKGGLVFASISVAFEKSCALTKQGAAYCWGRGILGDGQNIGGGGYEPGGNSPLAVAGGQKFVSINAGSSTCALTTTGDVYCWGSNTRGELGDAGQNPRLTPFKVSNGLPVNATAPSISGAVKSGLDLTASNGGWAAISYYPPTREIFQYAWYTCTATGGAVGTKPSNCTAITGATSNKLTLTTAQVGKYIRVMVTATNDNGASTYYSSATSKVIK